MKVRTWRAAIGCLLLVTASAIGLGATAEAGTVVIKWAYIHVMGWPQHQAAIKFQEWMKERTNGQVEVQLFPASQLGDEKGLQELLRMGSVHMVSGSTGIISQGLPQIGVLDAPYLFRNHEHFFKTARSPIAKELSDQLVAKQGVRIGGLFYNGERMLITRRPVKSLEDLKGMKIRAPEIPVYVEIFRALGASPTPMAYGEVYLALRQGAIDGMENPLAGLLSQKFYEGAKYVALTKHIMQFEAITVNERFHQGLSPEIKKVFDTTLAETLTYLSDLAIKREGEFLEGLKAAGTVIQELDLEPFRRATRDVHLKFKDKWGDLYERIQRY